MPEYHNIPVKRETAERLAEKKDLGESWDDVVRRQAFDGPERAAEAAEHQK